jgi:hypothetical protein
MRVPDVRPFGRCTRGRIVPSMRKGGLLEMTARLPRGVRGGRFRDITIGLTQSQYAYLHAEAEARTTSVGQLIREMLTDYLPPLSNVITPREKPSRLDKSRQA